MKKIAGIVLFLALCCGLTVSLAETRQLFTKEQMEKEREQLKERVRAYLVTLMHEPEEGEPWGLFKYCAGVARPWDLIGTADAWGVASDVGGIESLPGYHPGAREEMAAFLQQFQDPETGFFYAPYLDKTFESEDKIPHAYRRAVTKYVNALMSTHCGVKPRYPFSLSTGKTNTFDPDAYLKTIKNGNWSKPWGVGSHTALATVEGFRLICDGREDLIPVVEEGIDLILSHQNPETGMWGPETISIDQQIGGVLKVVSRLQSHMGFIIPHMDKLADSVIKYHENGEFYQHMSCASVPRNVAFMAHACLVASDYRKQELRNVLWEIAQNEFDCLEQRDGGYSYLPDPRAPRHWCLATVAGRTEEPMSDVHGTINAANAIFRIYDWLERTEDDTERKRMQERWAGFSYKVILNDGGEAKIVKRDEG